MSDFGVIPHHGDGTENPRGSGRRLGRMMATEPELTTTPADEAGREMIKCFVAYVTADGFGVGCMATRMERLKFETIVSEKSYGEVLAEWNAGEAGPVTRS